MNTVTTWLYQQATLISKIITLKPKKETQSSLNYDLTVPSPLCAEVDETTSMPDSIEEKSDYELAWDYALGRNVERNITLAIEKMLYFARNGSGEDSFKASQAFWTGHVFPNDPILSIELLKRAYELGFNVAMSSRMIGSFYKNSLGDIDNAIAWLTISSEHNDSDSAYALSNIYSSLDKHELAFQWMLKSANLGKHTAEYMVGFFYEQGQGVAQDYHEAFHWYEIASNYKEKEATKGLARLYKHGKGTGLSISKAEELYASINAHWELALMHLELYNNEKAIEHLLKLTCDKDAMSLLGSTYCHYPTNNPQYHKAIEPYTIAAKLGDHGAMYSLGELYFSGFGIPKNYKESYFWFSIAQAHGNISAKEKVLSLEEKLSQDDISSIQDRTANFYKDHIKYS
ncbi:tetratricopeptide repeat protein [Aeromonas veronii]